MRSKPGTCSGCPLADKGSGYADSVGPQNSPIALIGEALGKTEAQRSEPFVGPAGGVLNRILRMIGLDRASVRIGNQVACCPPQDWLDGAPWEWGALNHCKPQLENLLNEPHRVFMALGGVSTRQLLGLPRKGHLQKNWHGCVTKDPGGRLVVPTFHPSFILRGAKNLIGTACFDFKKAMEVASGRWKPQPADLVMDPDVQWFDAWVSELSPGTWLAVDVETVEKLSGADEGELSGTGDEIVRINFAYNTDQGITVPFGGSYLRGISRLLASDSVKCFWNARYDVPRLRAAYLLISEPILDFMWGWHVLQSDLPRGLGFVAPFYSEYGAWKHLSSESPAEYAAIDAVQTLRVAFGIARDLQAQNQWDVFWRHVYELDTKVLHPAESIGLLVDKREISTFKVKLEAVSAEKSKSITELVPSSVLRLHPKDGWTRSPKDEPIVVNYKRAKETFRVEYKLSDLIELQVETSTQRCASCGALQVAKTHRCEGEDLTPKIELIVAPVPRYFVREPFNPASPDHIRSYCQAKKHPLGKAKKSKTGAGSTDKKQLNALSKSTKDPIYGLILEHRAVGKVLGTYVNGSLSRMDQNDRLHTQFTHVPSTLRLSSTGPNLQNVVSDRSGPEALAAGFRRCLVAAPGCYLVEADFAAIEALETGWFAGDPDYIRLARLGVHAYLASHLLGRPADLRWSDADLGAYFKEIKKHHLRTYDVAKRCIHGSSYGLTAVGMTNQYPELFRTVGEAQKVQGVFLDLCPKLPAWWNSLRTRAKRQGYLGGSDHPFGYKHWFWDVAIYDTQYGKWRLGEDAKRVIAYYPQSTAAGVIKEAALRLLDPENPNYIGDLYYRKTPVRALVHDSILVEVPESKLASCVARMIAEMEREIVQQPCPAEWQIGPFLKINVAVKYGRDWMDMKEYVVRELGVGSDTVVRDAEEEEGDETAR